MDLQYKHLDKNLINFLLEFDILHLMILFQEVKVN